MAITAAERRRVREEAAGRCAYSHMANAWEPYFPYHVEHSVARQHGGTDDPSNLALACHHCNLVKGPNLTSIGPDTGLVTPIFHPQRQRWEEHFRFEGERVLGTTAVGRG